MYSKKAKIKLLLKAALAAGTFGFVAVFGVFAYYAKDLPSPANISELKITESTKIYDRSGEILLYDIHGEQKRTVIAIEDAPAYIKYATIVAEDDGFYKHFGVDFKGVARAALSNIQSKAVRQGGSTITQQLIKNIYLTPEKTVARKIKELILAIEMELKYDKEEILSFYLNIVPYGSNAYGIEAASQTFFNKHANELNISEAALLASLPKAPTYYSPFGNNPEELDKRQKYVLSRMYELGYISQEQYEEAKNYEIGYSGEATGIKAPHFVMYIIEYLEEKYGKDKLKNSGFSVVTTLDWRLQEEAEKVVRKWAETNEPRFGAKNAALVAIDPKTGQILSMVGSRDYFDQENDGNVNVTTRLRQPGSSFKPFAYAKAFEKGYAPDTVLFDVFTEFNPDCEKNGAEEKDAYGLACYHPKNYTETFRGPVTMKEALAQSINVPAVKVLHLAGVKETIELAKNMGITSLNDPDRYGLSLVLGGGEVRLLDETSAYGAFSQEGTLQKTNGIIKITDKTGEVVEEFEESPKEVLDPQIARTITSILSNNDYRAPVFGEQNYLNLGYIPAAVKTGTTQEYRDAWTVGYTKDVVVGVWVGNNDNSKMYNAPGASAAGPIWNEFMKKIYEVKNYPIKEFAPPDPIEASESAFNGSLSGYVSVKIDKISGKLATEYTPPELSEEKFFYEPHSILYFAKKDDSQLEAWEAGIRQWMNEQKTLGFGIFGAPKEYDNIHTKETLPQTLINTPLGGSQFYAGAIAPLSFNVQNVFDVTKLEVFFDGQVVKTIQGLSLNNEVFSTSFRIPKNAEGGVHALRVRVFDEVLNRNDAEISINIY